MKRLISILLIPVSLVILGYVIYSCGNPDSGAKAVQITSDQQISEWREDNRTGVSSETGLLKSWPESGPELIWTNIELPMGYSSVSFGNNTIYVTGNDKENDILVALDTYGKIKWQTVYGRAWNAATPESRCTPTVEGDKVYVSSGFGDIACIDGTSGTIIWSLKASETFKGTYGEWGIAESLIIDGDKLYYTPGGPETTTIALKKINHLDALSTEKSTVIWPDAPLIKCVTPLYHDGKIYMTGGYDHGAIMLN